MLFLCQCEIKIGALSVQGDLVGEELHCFLSDGMKYHVKFDGLSDDLLIDVADVDFELVVEDFLAEFIGESQVLWFWRVHFFFFLYFLNSNLYATKYQ